MSGRDGRWADLSSQNERVVKLNESTASSAGCHSRAARPEWAALASQRERLVDATDPEFRLVGSSHASPGHASSGHTGSGMRLVAGAA
jgi:hypothetical protein